MKRILYAIFLMAPLLNAAAQQEYFTPQKNIFIYSGMWFLQKDDDTTAEVYWNAFAGLPVQDPLVIPETVQDSSGNIFTVTRVGNSAFANKRIRDITLPESIREIGENAFSGNDSLSNINLPAGVRRIEGYAFASCKLSGTISLSDSLEYLSPFAFYFNTRTVGSNGTMITEYDIAANSHFCTVDGFLYNSDTTELLLAPNVGVDTFYVPANVRRLGEVSLTECGASHIILNNGLREIGLYSISSSVRQITIPASVTHIDGCIRNGNPSIPLLTITIDSAGQHYRVEDLMLLSYDGDTLVMGYGVWSGTKDLPEGIRVIAQGALSGVGSFDRLELPNSLEEICDHAFSNTGCRIGGFPGNLRKIGTRIMPYSTIGNLRLPNSLTDIADYALEESYIDTVTIGDSLRVIPRGLFYMNHLKKVTLGRSVEHIMPEAFTRDWYGLSFNLTINDDYMPEGLRTIGRDAFRDCKIERVRFRHNPDTVGEYAFNRLKRVFFVDTIPPVVYDSSFMATCDVYVPCHGADAFSAAPGWGPSFHYLESPCPPTAVEDADIVPAVVLNTVGNLLTVERNEAVKVGIYDLFGRCLSLSPASTAAISFFAPSTGVYIVRAGGKTMKALLVK